MVDRSNLERFITLEQAAQQLRQDTAGVMRLIEDGALRAAILPDNAIGVSLSSLRSLQPREELPDYQDFASLKGEAISISDAARKYGIHTSTLTRWMQRGYIAQLGKDGRRTLLDEADAAYCAKVYLSDSGQGKWLFDEKGKPVGEGKRKRGARTA
jgi:hypothetical protein